MTYVPGFVHDVFVSFAHIDNVPLGRWPAWVTSFVRNLETYVRMLLGTRDELSIFFDGHCSLQSGRRLSDELTRIAAGAATFLPIISPAYVDKGSWGLEELSAFHAAKRDGQRIFPIELLPLESKEDYPIPVRDLARFQFWTKRDSAPVPIPPRSQALCDRLIILGHQIRCHLAHMRDASQGAA